MNIAQIRAKAQEMGLRVQGRTKADLIRSIQSQEGNFPCFGSSSGECDQGECYWGDDCLPRSSAARC